MISNRDNHIEARLADPEGFEYCGCPDICQVELAKRATLEDNVPPSVIPDVGQAEGFDPPSQLVSKCNGQLSPVVIEPVSESLGDAIEMFRKRGKPRKVITPDQQAVLDRTDLTVRQKAELSGLSVSTVGRLTKRG